VSLKRPDVSWRDEFGSEDDAIQSVDRAFLLLRWPPMRLVEYKSCRPFGENSRTLGTWRSQSVWAKALSKPGVVDWAMMTEGG
jgi:hypothetical protein